MRFLNNYNEEKLPDGFVLDTLKEELDEAVSQDTKEGYKRAQEIKDLMATLIADNDAYKKKYNLDEYWFQEVLDENVQTRNFTMTQKEFFTYMSQVNKILKFMYPNSYRQIVTEDGKIDLLTALPSEKEQGRDYSVLNKVDTNIKLITTMVNKFNIKSFIDLIKFIRKERVDLFRDNGKYFSMVFDTIRSTELVGERSEEKVCQYIKELTKKRYQIDIEPKREITSSYKDMVLGIDITFTINGKDSTVQVKPLKGNTEKEGVINVLSSGRVKKYNTDYLGFVSQNQVMLFRNKNIIVSGNTFKIPKENLVSI